MNREHIVSNRWLWAVLALLLATGLAAAEQTPPLKVYRATYLANYGGMSGEALETLSLDHGGVYHAAQTLSAVVVSAQEHSQFRYVDGQLRPNKYKYSLSMLFKKREQEEKFDWQKNLVTHTYKGKNSVQKAPPGLHDRFSSRMQLRLDLASGKKEFRYQVAEKGRIKTYEFAVEGEEQLQTFAGPVQAVRVRRVREEDSSRQTRMWFVPKWNWLPARLEQVEDDSEFTLELTGGRVGDLELRPVESK